MITGCGFIDVSCGALITSDFFLSAARNQLLQKRENDRVARMRADEKEKTAERRRQVAIEKAVKWSASFLVECIVQNRKSG